MRILLAAVLGCTLAACGGGGEGDLPDAGYNCDLDDRDEQFVAGMQKTGNLGITFTLVESTPAPPARDNNIWVIDVEDGAGALVGATLGIKPFMPDHNHGTSIPAIITEDATTAGRYNAEQVNLAMPGIWEVTVSATPDGGGAIDKDSVIFTFCIAS
jgi:hypothetical protein